MASPPTFPPRLDDYREEPPFHHETEGHRFDFYPRGEDRWQALLDLVADARERLEVCFYIFAQDDFSRSFRDALAAAAARGVAVTLIIDRFGAEASDAFLEPLVAAGGRHLCFSPKKTQRYLIRNHQKMVIADRRRAMIGGFNIERDYFAPVAGTGWNDLGIIVEGKAAEGLSQWFGQLTAWADRPRPRFRDLTRMLVRWNWSCADGRLRWLLGGPTRDASGWARCVTRDLVTARRLDIFMAYFTPPYTLLRRIARVAQGGEVRLVMAAKSDNGATVGASRSLYRYLLKRRVRVWEFQPGKLHTKLLVIDDAVYFGSANFDMRSLYLNLEVMFRIEDAALAERMRAYVARHIAVSEEITPALHRQRATPLNRIRWALGWVLVSVIDYTVSRRLNLGL